MFLAAFTRFRVWNSNEDLNMSATFLRLAVAVLRRTQKTGIIIIILFFFFYSCCSHLQHKACVKRSFHFSFLDSRQDSFDGGSARRKAAT
jgi:hypothetical protein